MFVKIRNIAFLFLLFLSLPSSAIDPVTVMVSLTPPYTPFLNEYAAAGTGKLQVTLMVNDSRMNNYPARLQMIIERIGSGVVMRTAEYAAIAPVLLTGNVTEIFSGADLQPYFLAQNNVFAGFSQGQYMQTGRIPDGQYRIGFRVVDARRTDVVLSNTAFSQPAWFVLNDPPQLNLPRNHSTERVNELQSVRFEWFPRHLGSMNASFASSYQIELFAIRIAGMDARQVALSVPADFTDVTTRTSYQLTADKFMLEPGVEYAWRVRAMAGVDELTLFQNNGYSEVYSFTYGSACPVPSNVNARATSGENAEISWDTDPMHSSYTVRLRKAGNGDYVWHTRETFDNILQIKKILTPDTRYEYQVSARCNSVESSYSPLASFTTPPLPPVNFVCGASDSVPAITNHVPKATLMPGEVIYYGKFPIKLYEVSGSNGTFKGKGRMRIPFLNNIQVNMQFEAIQVNELNQVTDGELVSIFNPDSRYYIDDVTDLFAEGDQYGNVISGRESAAVTLTYSVTDATQLKVTYSDGTVTVAGPGGVASAEVQPAGAGITIADSQGNLFAADEKGKVTLIGKMAATAGDEEKPRGYDQTAASLNRLDSEIKVYFENNDDWALDERKPAYAGSRFDSEYENLGGYYVPWKFIPAGSYGKVSARLEGNLPAGARLVFRTPAGTEYFSKKAGNRYELTIAAASARDAIEVYALVAEGDSVTRSVGKIRAASYPLLEHSVVLVPMDEGLKPDATAIKRQLDAIYRPYGISWNVRVDDVFSDRSWDTDRNGLQATGSEFYSVFTPEMRALNSAYIQQRGLDGVSVYLFVFRQAGEGSQTLLGDMPLESRFGYIFNYSSGDKTWLTIAHELGHGIFQLRHPFSDKYGLRQGSTDNLMDYTSDGLALKKYQWDIIHDPQNRLFAWAESEEEGEYYEFTFDDLWSQNINNIACAKKNNFSKVKLKEIIPGVKGYFNYGTIGKIKLEIPEWAASKTDNEINLLSQEISDYTDVNDGKKYIRVIYKSVSGKYRIFLKIAPEKKDEFLSILNNPSDHFFTGLCGSIPSSESKEAYSKLAQLPICSYEEISITNRIKYFEWLSGEKWTNEDQELIMLDLLTHVKDRKELYAELYKRPVLLAKMMLSCDGETRQKFINEITRLCDENWISNSQAKGVVYIGKVPNSFGNNYSGYDFITYAILTEGSSNCSVSNYIGRFPKGMFDWGNVQVLRPLSTFNCNLLDPVEIISSDGSQGIFPLIYPVNLSQQYGNQQVGQQFAATLNYLGVASSVKILNTGSRMAKSIAFVELTKTGIDAIFNDPQVIETLNQTEDGKNFLKYWQIASVTIDIATIGTEVLENLIKHGSEASKALRVAGKNDAADNVDDLVSEAKALNKANADKIADLVRKFEELTPAEVKDLFNKLEKSDIKAVSSKQWGAVTANQNFKLEYISENVDVNLENYIPPYKPGTFVDEIVLAEDAFFVRLHTERGQIGRWMMTIEDFKVLSKDPSKLKEVLALPSLPTKASLVKVPKETKIWKGQAAGNRWGIGGGIQVQIDSWADFSLQQRISWFKPLQNI